MKCPNCGADMQENALYCEKCGRDIHIVPDFDPELENNILESLQHIAEDVNEGITEQKNVGEKRRKQKGRFVLVAMSSCVMALLIVVIFSCIRLYQYFSYDFQVQRAAACLAKNKYDNAIDYYLRAIELDNSDVELVFSLAEAYMQMGNKIEYEYQLREIIRNPLCSQDQLERAYGKLIAIYRDREEYDIINEILQDCKNEAIRNAYQVYLASPPQFNYEEGEYNKIIPLKLTSSTVGRIYYTTDGSEPDSESLLYTAPILLEKRNTTIKAVVINEYGVSSEVVTKEYHIEVDMEEAPEISAISGTYYIPMMIEVTEEEGKDVYYTTDGSTPNLHSNLYTEPIPMPLGKSEFCFAFVKEDGTCGEIAERSYELELNAEVTVEEAKALVVEYMLILKKIYNEEGYFSTDSGARYLYEYQSVISVPGQGDFYVIAEIFRDEKGVQNKTGSFYAVNIRKKECFKLVTEENNNYSLVEILIDSPDEG